MECRRVVASTFICGFLLMAVSAGAADLTGGVKLKLNDKADFAKDSAAVAFVKDAAIAEPLPDPTSEAARLRISSADGNAGWFDLDAALWKVLGTKGYKYVNKDKAGPIHSVVLVTANGKGKLIVKLKGETYGVVALAGPVDYVEARLEIGATQYCGRFEPGISVEKRNEAGSVLLKGPSTACVEPLVKRVFETSITYTGNLGGLTGADAKCQERADAATLGGTWKAWLSSSTEDARDRITDALYELVDGTIIAASLADLTNGGISHPIDLDENGAAIPGPGHNQSWTGTHSDGTWAGRDCQSWTSASNADTAMIGYLEYQDTWWTEGFDGADCSYNDTRGLYCFEQ